MKSVYLGTSPLHSSSVRLILNPKTHGIIPQFQVIYDDYFETIPFSESEPSDNWHSFFMEGFEKMDFEFDPADFQDSWYHPPDPDPSEEGYGQQMELPNGFVEPRGQPRRSTRDKR